MDLIKDIRKVEIIENRLHITRTTTEAYDAEEYLRTLTGQEGKKAEFAGAIKDIDELLVVLNQWKKHAEEILKKTRETQKISVAKAVAKHPIKDKKNFVDIK